VKIADDKRLPPGGNIQNRRRVKPGAYHIGKKRSGHQLKNIILPDPLTMLIPDFRGSLYPAAMVTWIESGGYMRLNRKELTNKAQWEKAGIDLPRFDTEAMIKATRETPQWVHFGAGNIFRAFPAALLQSLLDQGAAKTGILVAEGYDGEIIDRVFLPYDNLTMAVTLKADGTIQKKVIASVAEAFRIDHTGDFEKLKGIFRAKSLQMASFTITE
jgi:hypothetical protein